MPGFGNDTGRGRSADLITSQGRVVLETSDSHYLLLHIAHAMARIDVGITLRPAYDTYREQACGTLIVWLADLVESVVENDDLFLRRVIASAMFSRYQRGHGDTNPEDQDIDIESAEVWEEYEEIGDMQRADWLFCLFSRLWRKPRTDMMKVLVKILTTDVKCKLAIGGCERWPARWPRKILLTMTLSGQAITLRRSIIVSSINTYSVIENPNSTSFCGACNCSPSHPLPNPPSETRTSPDALSKSSSPTSPNNMTTIGYIFPRECECQHEQTLRHSHSERRSGRPSRVTCVQCSTRKVFAGS